MDLIRYDLNLIWHSVVWTWSMNLCCHFWIRWTVNKTVSTHLFLLGYSDTPHQVSHGVICENCKGTMSAELCTSDSVLDPDLGFAGSPCNPFSTQRAKRFQTGNVKSHDLYTVTDDSNLASEWNASASVMNIWHIDILSWMFNDKNHFWCVKKKNIGVRHQLKLPPTIATVLINTRWDR